MLKPVEAHCLKDISGLRHGFFTRAGGVSGGPYQALNCGLGSHDDPAKVLENRARVARHLGAAAPEVLTVYQVHSPTALVVDRLQPAAALGRADALVTKTPGLAIGVLTADCAPVLLADPAAQIVAAAHAGWRGALAGILEATVAAMESLGARWGRIRAAVGPTINQSSYEVGPEFEAEFLANDRASAPFFQRKGHGGRPNFDLPAYVVDRLTRTGVEIAEQQSRCTYETESLFFSFRRAQHRSEADYGRQISAIVVT
jgi:YfiH family protein